MNDCVFSNNTPTPHVVSMEALDHVLEFNKANPHLCVNKRIIDHGMTFGNPYDWHIVQVDAGCFRNGTLTLGYVIKNKDLQVKMATCRRLENMDNASIAEAMAIA